MQLTQLKIFQWKLLRLHFQVILSLLSVLNGKNQAIAGGRTKVGPVAMVSLLIDAGLGGVMAGSCRETEIVHQVC